MPTKPFVSPRVAAEIKMLEQAIKNAQEELRELKRKESLVRPRGHFARRAKPR